MIILNEIPMPPTANKRLIPVNGRLIKSNDCRAFDKSVQVWMIRQKSKLFEDRRKAKEWIGTGFMIKVDFVFYWPKIKLMSKDGLPKKLDDSNRLKDAEDAVSEIIGIDDKWFVDKTLKKVPWNKEYEAFSATVSYCKWELQD